MTDAIKLQPQFLETEGLIRLLDELGLDFGDEPWQVSPNVFRGMSAEVVNPIEIGSNPKKVGIFSSAGEGRDDSASVIRGAREGARNMALATAGYNNVIYVTGACPDWSVPTGFAMDIKDIDKDIPIIGVSPHNIDTVSHRTPGWNIVRDLHDIIIYTDFDDFLMRDAVNDHMVDGAYFIRGSAGTNHEQAGLYEPGKVSAQLLGYGGVTDAQAEIVERIRDDGKDHFVVIADYDPKNLAARFIAQLEVDKYLRRHDASDVKMSSLDLYLHTSNKRKIVEPILNGWKVQRRQEQPDWRKNKDRRLAFEHYRGRSDITDHGKILVMGDRDEIIGELEETLRTVYRVGPRDGEAGIFLFPTSLDPTEMHDRMQTTLDSIGTRRTVTYNNINAA